MGKEEAGFVQAAKGKGSNAFKTVYDFFQHIIESIANYSYTGAGKTSRYRNRETGRGSGAGAGLSEGTHLAGSGNPMVSNELYSSGGNYGGGGGSQPSTYPYATGQPPGQYAASQFTTYRAQTQGSSGY